jgi:rhodanese-related sulfurtransferase
MRTPLATGAILGITGLALLAPTTGCYRPQGGLMPYTGAASTYISYETQQKSVQIIDVRSGDVVFSMDIPAGKQLTMDFVEDEGDDPVLSPDLLRYEIFDAGKKTGKLHNVMSVPPAHSRRIEVQVRTGIEYTKPASDRELRTDEVMDRPEWWTPAGGALEEDVRGLHNYDD